MFEERSNLFFILFYPPLFDYDVSMHGFVELGVLNPMSPRSLKMASGWSSYRCFWFAISSRIDYPPNVG
jgi:hypothetical protein